MDSVSLELSPSTVAAEVAAVSIPVNITNSVAELAELDRLELNAAISSVPSSELAHLLPNRNTTNARRLSTLTLHPAKDALRASLKASTIDGVFATVFSNVTGGVLLTGFLMQLGASPSQIGLLASIPMIANLIQPIGAYWSEQVSSRRWFCFWIYGISRLLWLVLVAAIFWLTWQPIAPLDLNQRLISLTLMVALASCVLGAMGSAPWLSWMAMLVPRQLRGRYFGLRNSAANLANLLSLPLLGYAVANGFGGSVQGYGVVLGVGIGFGLISLGFQQFIADVPPQNQLPSSTNVSKTTSTRWQGGISPNFLLFLLYFSLSMFALNLSAPFFNLYMLDRLALDMSQVTLYNSLTAGANLFMLMVWGKLSDRVGNRVILLSVGLLVGITPLLWLIPSANSLSNWLWLPLLHVLMGGTLAAIDLCTNNLQIGVTPTQNQATYFAMVAAVVGLTSALGATVGGYLVQYWHQAGFWGVFVLSGILRFAALLPLLLIHEPNRSSLNHWIGFTMALFASNAKHDGNITCHSSTRNAQNPQQF